MVSGLHFSLWFPAVHCFVVVLCNKAKLSGLAVSECEVSLLFALPAAANLQSVTEFHGDPAHAGPAAQLSLTPEVFASRLPLDGSTCSQPPCGQEPHQRAQQATTSISRAEDTANHQAAHLWHSLPTQQGTGALLPTALLLQLCAHQLQ